MRSSFQVIHQIQKTVFDHISKEKRKDDLTVHVMHAIACHKQIMSLLRELLGVHYYRRLVISGPIKACLFSEH